MKKFLTSVADAFFYDDSDNLLFVAKTLLDSSFEATISNTEIRGGRGNVLQYQFFHSAAVNLTLTDVQWNLDFLANTVGQDLVTGTNIYTEETVTLGGGGAGSVVGTPLAIQGTSVYGWITHEDGTTERITFSTRAFTSSHGTSGDIVCVRYYALDSSARELTIPASFIPKIGRMVLEAGLYSSDETSNLIGKAQIVIPKLTLSGQFTLSMTSDGVSNTPLTGMALAYTSTSTASCSNVPVYAYIKEIIDSSNWYDSDRLAGIAIGGGDFTLVNGSTKQLVCYGVPYVGAAFVIPHSLLTWSSSVTGDATVVNGLVTWISDGASVIHVTVTAATAYDASVTVTCSA